MKDTNDGKRPEAGLNLIVNSIYESIKPDPIRYWNIVGSTPSDDIKIAVVRHLVREYASENHMRILPNNVAEIAGLLYDKLSYESIQRIVDMDTEYKRLKDDGSLKKEADRVYSEVRKETENKRARESQPSSMNWSSTFEKPNRPKKSKW